VKTRGYVSALVKEDYDEKILGFFVGQAMKATQGKANPKLLNELLRSKLG
jgi:Asp-tRNA(Asn)/Glu-tRNA(Gln) amidotransferase B subunit